MISTVNYLKLKNILFKHYKGSEVRIEMRGIIQNRISIDKTRITINKQKLIFSNEENDYIIEFMLMRKIKLEDFHRLELIFEDFTIYLYV